MMNAVLETRNSYENFVLQKDILYFRVGERGLVSYHGKNYNIKKRMSTDDIQKLIADPAFFKVNTDCYANLNKIVSIEDGLVYFVHKGAESKFVAITKLRQHRLKELLAAAAQEQAL